MNRYPANSVSSLFAKSDLDEYVRDIIPPSLILGLLFFQDYINPEEIRQTLQQRFVKVYAKFRSIIVMKGGKIYFEEIPLEDIDMNYHVQSVDSTGWKQQDISNFLSKLYTTHKSIERPLWTFHVLNNLENGRSCLIANIDHCLGDGIAMVEVLLSILDKNECEKTPSSDGGHVAYGTKTTKKKTSSLSALDKVLVFAKGVCRGLLGSMISGDTFNSLKIIDCMRPDKRKVCAFGEYISLNKVKEVQAKFPGSTVNDILASVLTLTIRKYLEDKGDPVLNPHSQSLVRASFPLSMRSSSTSNNMKTPSSSSISTSVDNIFAMGEFVFDFKSSNGCDLVWGVKDQVDRIKASPQPYVELWLLDFLSAVAPLKLLVHIFLETVGKFTMMLSNIPGPINPAYFDGKLITDLNFVACGINGTYCGLLSYNGKVAMSVCCDASIEENPENIVKHWRDSFEELHKEATAFPDAVPTPTRKSLMTTGVLCLIAASIVTMVVAIYMS